MSTSGNKGRNRKDFSFSGGVASVLANQEELVAAKETLNIEKEEESVKPESTNVVSADMKEPASFTETYKNNNDETIQENIPDAAKEVLSAEPLSELEEFLSRTRTEAGVSKSIYLERDVYQYIKDRCDRTHTKFSAVVNVIIKKYIEEHL